MSCCCVSNISGLPSALLPPFGDIATSVTIAATTSAVPIDAPFMILSPRAGNYMVHYSVQCSVNNNFALPACGIAVAGVDVVDSQRDEGASPFSLRVSLDTQARVTVSPGQSITARFWRASGAGTVFILNRSLIIQETS